MTTKMRSTKKQKCATIANLTNVKPAIKEKAFMNQVIEYARLCGWWVYHDFDSRMSEAGLPDLILLRPPELLFIELKSMTGKLSDQQEEILEKLQDVVCVGAYAYRPTDFNSIEAILKKVEEPTVAEICAIEAGIARGLENIKLLSRNKE